MDSGVIFLGSARLIVFGSQREANWAKLDAHFPQKWGPIMWVIRSIPERIFKSKICNLGIRHQDSMNFG